MRDACTNECWLAGSAGRAGAGRGMSSPPDRMNSSLLRAYLHASTQPGFGSLSEPRASSRPLQRPGSQRLPGLHLESAFAAQKILLAVSPCSLFMLLGKQKGGPRGVCGDGWGEGGESLMGTVYGIGSHHRPCEQSSNCMNPKQSIKLGKIRGR